MRRLSPLLLIVVLLGCGLQPQTETPDANQTESDAPLAETPAVADVETVSTSDTSAQPSSPETPVSYPSTVIHGTFSWDVEDDSLGRSSNVDLWWEHQTATERQLTAQNGATLARITDREFDEIDHDYLEGIDYPEQSIAGSDENNLLTPGTVVGLRTAEGNFAKLRVKGYSEGGRGNMRANYNIELEWVLYGPPL